MYVGSEGDEEGVVNQHIPDENRRHPSDTVCTV